MDMDVIIKRLEEATEGSRELDGAIFIVDFRLRYPTFTVPAIWDEDGEIYDFIPYYTTSLDAAITLVPEGDWNGEISWRFGDSKVGGFVEMALANPEWMKPGYDPSQPPHNHAACVDSYGDQESTCIKPRPLALALCLAALKARATQGQPK